LTPEERRRIVLRAMDDKPLRTKEIATLLGISTEAAHSMLQRWTQRGGIVGVCSASRVTLWTTTARAPALAAAEMVDRAARKKARKARSNNRWRARSVGIDPDESVEDMPVDQRIVPAASAPPLRPAGPASVWGLAA